MAKGESTLSTRYRLRKKTDTSTAIKPDVQSTKIDRKSEYKSILGRSTQITARKTNVTKSNSTTKAPGDRSLASVPEQTKKHAVATIENYIVRNKSDASYSGLATAENSFRTNDDGDTRLKSNESSNRKHTLSNNEDKGSVETDVDLNRSPKVRKISLETDTVVDHDIALENTQEEPLTPKSQTSDKDIQLEQTSNLTHKGTSTATLPISPARTPTKPLASTNYKQGSDEEMVSQMMGPSLNNKGHSASLELLNPSPGTPVRFRQPQSSSESDPSHINQMYRLRQDRSGLKLPDKYEALERMHYSLDHTILFTTAQNSVCHFHKIRKPVENMSRRSFNLNHLAQIKHIQPDAYSLRPVRVLHEGQRVESILIGFPEDEDQSQTTSSTQASHPTAKKIVTARQIEERKTSFHNKLIDLVKSSHDTFLKKLKPDSNENDTRILKQWHPMFNLDSVPDVPEAELPSFPSKVVDAAEYVRSGTLKSRISDTLAKLDKKLGPKKSLDSTEIKQVSVSVANPQDGPSETGAKDTIKSRTSSLLERIRAKQQKKQESAMYEPSPDAVQRNILLSRLPDMVDSIYYMYTSAKRNVMFVREVSRKLSESYKVPLSESEAEQHIVLLAEVAPKWCSIAVADTGSILRIDRTMLLKEVRAMLPEKTA